MARMNFITRFLPALAGAGLLSLGALGCVSQEDYMALKMDRDNLAEQLADAQAEARSNGKLAAGYRSQISQIANGENAEDAMQANYQQRIANLTAERDALMGKYENMLNQIGTGPALPVELTNELTQFATANPDLVAFDADRGIVKFKSDVTFNSGDATLKPEAKQVINRFATILQQPVASQYELRVAGHTDNEPVSNPLTKQKGHKDNWYLSSHRAISVAEALMDQGVNSARIGVTGFAAQRPIASNNTEAGRAQNRRVEVLILPTTVTQATPEPAPGQTQAAAPAESPAAATPPAPVYGK